MIRKAKSKSKDKKEKAAMPNKDIPLVDLIERIPSDKVDLDKFGKFLYTQLESIKADRKVWDARRSEYFQDIDNFVNYYTDQDLPFENASNVHVPVTMEKQRAVHARLYQALFGVRPPFYVEPQEEMDEKRLNSIYQLMRWALTRGINYYKGIKGEADGFLWNFASEGWGIMHLSHEKKVRKALVVEQEEIPSSARKTTVNEDGTQKTEPPIKLKEVMKWITRFDGPVVRNIQNEDVLMPGEGDIQQVPVFGMRQSFTAHDLRYYAASEYFDREAVELALLVPDSTTAYLNSDSTLRTQKGVNQGYDINSESNKQKDSEGMIAQYESVLCYCTYDIDGDGFDEELVAYFHPSSGQVLRWTYLDRITSTGRRPIYKADFIVRPGRNYALGLLELLHPLSIEVDSIHNQRVDNGTFSNMPFFFYRALSNLPNQEIEVSPGKGIPVDNPTEDVYFPQVKGGTAWGFQEESLLFQIVNRVSGIGDLNLGMTPSNSDAVRSQGQLLSVLNEGNAQLDIPLRRVQGMFGDIFSDVHQMLVDTLPNNFQHVVIGDDDTVLRDPRSGQVLANKYSDPRLEVAGRVHFNIQTNSAAGSKALLFQKRIQLYQMMMNPINLQLGQIGPEELYKWNTKILEASDEVDIRDLIKKPQDVPKPLSLTEELGMIQQGLMPEIPMNDDHQAKSDAINAWMKDQSTLDGIRLGTLSNQALAVANQAVAVHQKYLQMISQATQMHQNATGSQTPMPPQVGSIPQGGQPPQGGPQPPAAPLNPSPNPQDVGSTGFVPQ